MVFPARRHIYIVFRGHGSFKICNPDVNAILRVRTLFGIIRKGDKEMWLHSTQCKQTKRLRMLLSEN